MYMSGQFCFSVFSSCSVGCAHWIAAATCMSAQTAGRSSSALLSYDAQTHLRKHQLCNTVHMLLAGTNDEQGVHAGGSAGRANTISSASFT